MNLPRSGVEGAFWPAVPTPSDATLLAVLQQLEHSQWWSREQLEAMQMRQLEPLLAHAARQVPWQKGRLRRLGGIRPGGLTMDHVRALPLLTRIDIQEAGDSMLSRALPQQPGKTSTISTSGSTGRPLTVHTTQLTDLFFRALIRSPNSGFTAGLGNAIFSRDGKPDDGEDRLHAALFLHLRL